MTPSEELSKIVGAQGVLEDPKVLKSYFKDYSLTPPKEPMMVVKAKDADEVLKLVLYANDNGIPIYPSSSRVHFYGGTVPRKDEAIILDLSEMNRIVEIDEMNRWVHIEPGVTWVQLQSVLEKKGFRSVIPLFPHGERSVLMDWLEREQPTLCKFEYSEMVASMWVVWGLGEKFATGSGAVNTFRQPGCYADGVNMQGPGTLDFWRFLQGAQGTLGVVTRGICKIEHLPAITKTFFFISDQVSDLIDPFIELGHRYVGHERFIVNGMAGCWDVGRLQSEGFLAELGRRSRCNRSSCREAPGDGGLPGGVCTDSAKKEVPPFGGSREVEGGFAGWRREIGPDVDQALA